MYKFNSLFFKYPIKYNKLISLASTFNKISFKNFYFQEEKHGAGDVLIL
jgi:hypothetical protein